MPTTVNIDDMNEYLLQLGFSSKEAVIYLALLEFGNQAASVIARKTGFPKSTALFLLENLVDKGFVTRSLRGRTLFFFANPLLLKKSVSEKLASQASALEQLVPLLKEFQSPYSSSPKVQFFEGVVSCRNAYNALLQSSTEVLEFGVHKDLMFRLGEDFMVSFINQRVSKGLFLRAIDCQSSVNAELIEMDNKHCREIRILPEGFGVLSSSIALYDNKVLLLNLHQDAFGVLMENAEVTSTLRTLFEVLWSTVAKGR